jgi:mRNA-degrading endonuclease RelE of RelBE toxin-antitoxin system
MSDKVPPITLDETKKFRKEVKKLLKKYNSARKDIEPLIKQLEAGEIPGDRIAENKYPVYKVRVPNSDTRKGKSSGYRVIYYTITLESILLTTIYSKSDMRNISNKDVEDIIGDYELEIDSPDERLSGQKTEIAIAEVEPQIDSIDREEDGL